MYHKGFARAKDERGWFHLDLNGQPAYDRRFAMLEPFYNGQARVRTFDGRLVVINETGRDLVALFSLKGDD